MKQTLARNWIWIAAALVVAVVVHAASVLLLPRFIMARALTLMTQNDPYNAMSHAQRATARARTIVRPSPDLLYSICPYDLAAAHGALRVHARDMPATYWSVSAFDANTNNFQIENDRQAKGGRVDFLIIAPGTYIDSAKLPVVVSPTRRGVVLFRTLIDDETRLAEIDAGRRHAACEPYVPQ